MNKNLVYVLAGSAVAAGVGAMAMKRINEDRIKRNYLKMKDNLESIISNGQDIPDPCNDWYVGTVTTLITRLNIRQSNTTSSSILGKLNKGDKIWVRVNSGTSFNPCISVFQGEVQMPNLKDASVTKNCDWFQYGGRVEYNNTDGRILPPTSCDVQGFVYAGYVVISEHESNLFRLYY